MPLWLSPVQAVVMPITDAQADYANDVSERLVAAGLRAEKDLRNEKINYKIREHTLQRVPFLLVAGEREKASATVAVRKRDGKDLGAMPVADVIALMQEQNSTKAQEI